MVDVFGIKLTCFSRNKKSLVMDNSLGLELDYSDYECDEDILKSVSQTLKQYINFMHDVHGDWSSYELELKVDESYDMQINFSYADKEYTIKTACVKDMWTVTNKGTFEVNTYLKRKNSVVNMMLERINHHIQNNQAELV